MEWPPPVDSVPKALLLIMFTTIFKKIKYL